MQLLVMRQLKRWKYWTAIQSCLRHQVTENSTSLSSPLDTTKSKYGGKHTITLIPGDGVGPELAACVKEVFRASKVPIEFDEITLSGVLSTEESLDSALVSIKRNGVALKGVLQTPIDTNSSTTSLNVRLRLRADLFANVVYCKSIPGVRCISPELDLVVIRENTEGEYSGLEHQSVPGVIESLKVITRFKSERIAKFAFDFAHRYQRKRVTAIHKANIMKLSDGLFLKACTDVAPLYPHIEFNSCIIDNCCMQLVSNPYQFDVMVLPNLYGNIVANIGAGLIGGAGIAPGENVGNNAVIYEPGARHTFKKRAFQNVANPTAMLLSSIHMLKHLDLTGHANLIESAIYRVYRNTEIRTEDVGGSNSTSEFVSAVKKQINYLVDNPAEILDRHEPFY